MSIETAAKDLAAELTRHEFIEIRCHHDADGIAAGSIMCSALYRAHVPFRLRVVHRIKPGDVPSGDHVLLCDLGSGIENLPEETMVIDHHIPIFEGPYHVNPRIDGISGDTDLCAAGTAYLVANELGDNRDLAGLVLPGIIGDGQRISGKNQEIYLESLANGVVNKNRGYRMPGRNIEERIALSTVPFFPNYSGNIEKIKDLIPDSSSLEESDDKKSLVRSLLVLDACKDGRPEALMNIWGDTYQLLREAVEDAHTLTFLIDACGKSRQGSLASTLCLRSSQGLDKIWEIAVSHRENLINEIKSLLSRDRDLSSRVRYYETCNREIVSDLADTFWNAFDETGPVVISSGTSDGASLLSIRGTVSGNEGLGSLVGRIAADCGGFGGGHKTRAGATIETSELTGFVKQIAEACS